MKITLYILCLIGGLSYGQESNVRQQHFNTKDHNVAIGGYDPVSYFNEVPLRGKEYINSAYAGVIYWFASEANLKQFKESSIKYEPQYGGWCAYALSLKGEKVKIDPKTYKIVDGKLYLFYNFYLTNTLKSWNKNEENLRRTADMNWRIFVP